MKKLLFSIFILTSFILTTFAQNGLKPQFNVIKPLISTKDDVDNFFKKGKKIKDKQGSVLYFPTKKDYKNYRSEKGDYKYWSFLYSSNYCNNGYDTPKGLVTYVEIVLFTKSHSIDELISSTVIDDSTKIPSVTNMLIQPRYLSEDGSVDIVTNSPTEPKQKAIISISLTTKQQEKFKCKDTKKTK